MIQFTCLDAILAMDFTQLRSNHKRATDEALHIFISNINGFFQQINAQNRPTETDMVRLNEMMEHILANINQVEYDFALTQYASDYSDLTPEVIQKMALSAQVKSIEHLPTRMQYWAATGEFGGCIRNPLEHRQAVKYIPRLEAAQLPVGTPPIVSTNPSAGL